MSEEDAADGVQGFLAHVCAKNLLAHAREERGRLSAWLLTCFGRYLSGQRIKERALKRGGGALHISIEREGAETLYQSEPQLAEAPAELYARAWAESLLEEALLRLSSHYASTGRAALFEVILPALDSPPPEASFAETAAQFGMTATALRSATQRMRNRYRSILLELAASRLGITSEAALHGELRALLRPR